MKINRKGFLLIETLIASLFIMGTFTVMYMNIVPLLGEYERRITYDDVDGKYAAHLMRRAILSDANVNSLLSFTNYKELNCTSFSSGNYCLTLKTELNIESMYITNYNTTNIKNTYTNTDKNLRAYIDDLPKFTKNSTGKFRIIIKLANEKFANIEVIK